MIILIIMTKYCSECVIFVLHFPNITHIKIFYLTKLFIKKILLKFKHKYAGISHYIRKKTKVRTQKIQSIQFISFDACIIIHSAIFSNQYTTVYVPNYIRYLGGYIDRTRQICLPINDEIHRCVTRLIRILFDYTMYNEMIRN